MARKRVKPDCLMCKKARAKELPGIAPDGSEYRYATKDLVFCSQRCAANWALVRVEDSLEEMHWCPVILEWKHGEQSDCSDCNPETKEEA